MLDVDKGDSSHVVLTWKKIDHGRYHIIIMNARGEVTYQEGKQHSFFASPSRLLWTFYLSGTYTYSSQDWHVSSVTGAILAAVLLKDSWTWSCHLLTCWSSFMSGLNGRAMSSSTTKNEFQVGGKYKLVRKIGSGSFGDIYLGVNLTNGEVLKILSDIMSVVIAAKIGWDFLQISPMV